MYDEAYLEETHLITTKDYEYLTGKSDRKTSVRLRKIYFNRDINYLGVVCREHTNFDRYSMNIRDFSDSRYEIEKQCYREGTFYSSYTYLDKAHCMQILRGDIEWMKKYPDLIVREFYIQIQANKLAAGVVVDYEREIYHMRHSADMVMFDKSIASTYDFDIENLFNPDMDMHERLDGGYCVMIYHQTVMIPRVVANILSCHDGRRMLIEY